MKTVLPNNILKCMRPEDRKPLGKAGKTSEEAISKHEYGQERKLHQQICQLLDIRNMVYVHSRTDKRATNGAGVPDFIIFLPGKPELCVEVKVGTNKLSEDQVNWFAKYYLGSGRPAQVVRSLEEVKTLLDEHNVSSGYSKGLIPTDALVGKQILSSGEKASR